MNTKTTEKTLEKNLDLLSKNELIDEALLKNVSGGARKKVIDICNVRCLGGGSDLCSEAICVAR